MGACPLVVKVWVRWFLGIAVLGLSWVLASPPFSGPDEPAHVSRAASVWSGHLAGREAPREAGEGRSVVDGVPWALSRGPRIAACFAFMPEEPACDIGFGTRDELTLVVSTAGRYPPLYYALVGAPVRLWPSETGLLLSRALATLIGAALLAGAACLIQRRRTAPVTRLGLMVAVTPTALFASAVINPSGLEIAVATLLWVACLDLWRDGPDRASLVAVGASGVLLALIRPASPAFVGLIGLTALVAFGRRPLLEALGQRPGRIVAGALGAAAALSLAWTVRHGALTLVPGASPERVDGFGEALGQALRRVPEHVEEMIGWFGWLDVRAPSIVMSLWIAATGLLIVAAVGKASARALATLLGLAVVVLVSPPLLDARSYDEMGLVWQGRYGLPLAVGIPLLAGHLADRRTDGGLGAALERRQVMTVAVALAVAQVLAFWWALRRYVTGIDGPVIPRIDQPWAPPVHSIVLCLTAAVGAGLIARAAAART